MVMSALSARLRRFMLSRLAHRHVVGLLLPHGAPTQVSPATLAGQRRQLAGRVLFPPFAGGRAALGVSGPQASSNKAPTEMPSLMAPHTPIASHTVQGTALADAVTALPALRIYRDPSDHRRTVMCGTMAQVCDALDRMVAAQG